MIVSLLEMEKVLFAERNGEKDVCLEVEKVFNGSIDRIKCIAEIHDILSRKDENANILDISLIIMSISRFYQCRADIEMKFDSILIPYAKAVSVALVVNELISNSVKHNHVEAGKLRVFISARLRKDGKYVMLVCRDNGAGFSGETVPGNGNVGVGTIVVDSVIADGMGGNVRKYNDGGAVVEIKIPMQSLLPKDLQ